MLFETSNHSSIERNIHNILRDNFLEQRSITWKPIKVELIVNSQLTDDFFGKEFFSTKYSPSIPAPVSRCVLREKKTIKRSIFLVLHLDPI